MFYLIQAYDARTHRFFNPDPALYKTEPEAKAYVATHNTPTLLCSYVPVQIGQMFVEPDQL